MYPTDNLKDYAVIVQDLQNHGGSIDALYHAVGREAVSQNAPRIYQKGFSDGVKVGTKLGLKKAGMYGGLLICGLLVVDGSRKVYRCYKEYREENDEFDIKDFAGYCGNKAVEPIVDFFAKPDIEEVV